MPRDLLKFLFNDSFKPDSDEAITNIFEKLAEVEDIEVKTGPLGAALKKLGYEGDAPCTNDDGSAQICFSNKMAYSDLARTLAQADGLMALAEIGWIPTFGEDDQDVLDVEPHYVLKFINIQDATPSDGDDVPDLEKLLAQMNEPNKDQHPGIENVKPGQILDPGRAKKNLVVPEPKNPTTKIKDSMSVIDSAIQPEDPLMIGERMNPEPHAPKGPIVIDGWSLVDEKTGAPIVSGTKAKDFRGDTAVITGGLPPQHSGSSGHVYTKSNMRYYPGVFDMKWTHPKYTDMGHTKEEGEEA
jgi:hypothetical protein